jgi:hypothetical protein
MTQEAKTKRIQELNDLFRTSFSNGKVVTTVGVASLDPEDYTAVLDKVRNFRDWRNIHDPYGEHDFGSIEHDGEQYFFKIDYYNKSMDQGSEDPTNPDVTTRVMTIMRADEY